MSGRYAIPALALLALLILLGIGLRLKPGEIPSPLIGQPRPSLALPRLQDPAAPATEPAPSGPYLVNFWASWCTPCLEEHPLLRRLAGQVTIIGVSYKDDAAAAERWLRRHGNPFALVLRDADGRRAIDWGVYGVPETFVVAADGRILHKHVGPLSAEAWEQDIRPLLERAGR